MAVADPEAEKSAYKLELGAWADHPGGKVAIAQGDSNPEGDQFFLENVGVLQPTNVTLIAKQPGDKLTLILAKQRWDEKLMEASTGPDRSTTLKIRTQGEVRMIVKAAGDPKPYWLLVWVGDEVKPDFADPVVPMKDFKGDKKGGSSVTSAVVGIGGVILIIAVLVIVIRRRARGGAK